MSAATGTSTGTGSLLSLPSTGAVRVLDLAQDKSLFYEILQQPDTTITTDTTGSLILPLPPILPVVIKTK